STSGASAARGSLRKSGSAAGARPRSSSIHWKRLPARRVGPGPKSSRRSPSFPRWVHERDVLMCGIVGVAHSHGVGPVSREIIDRMCAAIRHRGPDDRGVYLGGAVGLGMQRLSIIDLAGSNQPVFNEDGTKAIVFNGEIYNYRELRKELLSRGHVFRTDGDTETILHLYEDAGPNCVDRLRGMFAFAIWDSTARTLFLARDRFGIKPLYFSRDGWGLAFASELKALHAAGLVSRDLDWEAIDTYFQLGY